MAERYVDPTFELELGAQLLDFGEAAVRPFDAGDVARMAVADAGRRQAGRRGWHLGPAQLSTRTIYIAVVTLLLVALLVASLAAGRDVPRPPAGSRAFVTQAAISPDGSRIAFLAGGRAGPAGEMSAYRQLYVVDADGSDLRLRLGDVPDWSPLYGMQGSLAWSSDGRYLALQVARAGTDSTVGQTAQLNSDVAVIDVAGGDPIIVTRDLPAGGVLVGWSPTQARLLVNTYLADGGSDAYLVGADGSGLTALTSDHLGLAIGWSPDGSKVLTEERSEAISSVDTVATSWLIAADGSGRVKVSQDGTLAAGWTPDGSRLLAWNATDASPGPVIADADGTNPRSLPVGTSDPSAWSHDGSAFVTTDEQGIYVGHVDGPYSRVFDRPTNQATLWSPRDDLIAIEATRPEGTGIWVVPAAGGPARLVAPNGVPAGWLATGDGHQRLAYLRDGGLEIVDVEGDVTTTVVPRASISEHVDPAVVGQGFQGRMVITDGGPDRDVYHVPIAPTLSFSIENRTDQTWQVIIDAGWFYQADCQPVAAGRVGLVMWRPGRDDQPGEDDTVVEPCLVPANTTIAFDVPHDVLGPEQIALVSAATGLDVAASDGIEQHLVILDFEPARPVAPSASG